MTAQGNTFLYFGDKNVSKVSVIWKALHISIYVAIAINSFVTAMAAGNMFQTFKYNCILYCTDIVFEKEVVPIESFQHTLALRDIDSKESIETIYDNTTVPENILSHNFSENEFEANATDGLSATVSFDKSNSTSDVPNKENRTIIFQNQSQIVVKEDDEITIIDAKIDVRKSMFASSFWCNYVLGMALVTFIFTTFCAVILAMCSKGGKGRNNTLNRPQNLIYPILVSSIILGILNLVASITVKNGMRGFCASFEMFTGEKSCSPLLNKFTLHERQGNFYLPYIVLAHTFNITVILFVGQVIVTFLRVIYAVDYQLYALELEGTEEEDVFEIEDGQIVKERRL